MGQHVRGYKLTMLTVPVVRVGNSRGVCISVKLLEAIGSPQAVQLDIRDGALIVTPAIHPRAHWDTPDAWDSAELRARTMSGLRQT